MRKLSSNKKVNIAAAAAVLLLGGSALYLGGFRSDPSPAPEATKAETKEEAAEAPEGVIELTAEQLQAAGISVVAVSRGGGGETRLSGRVEAMVDARAAVGAVVGGTVERVLVAPGQAVRAGQPLVSLVSGDGAALRAEIDAASAAATAARQAHQRNRNLADQGVVARQEVEASQAQAASAEAMARAARARAAAAGSPNASGRMSLVSPISGVVTNVQVGPGGFVAQGAVVAEVTNPARVELVFNAPPQLAAQVRLGSHVRVTGPQGEFNALVTGVAADAGLQDSGATVIRARPESGRLPPAGSPVTGAVVTEGQSGGALTVPSEAVQTVDGATVIFVRTGEGFRAQPVLAGRQAGGSTEILRGLTGSEKVASANAFLLKAELAKGEAEHGH
ncbi:MULTISPECIES: efflux RND transporter periplasmic adaptor subunit [Brevundimonas]|uniref:efflux RND transporter periplasmic adaptor subunit n=2 Tax=Pseudomonadota TaxID=1224 RepID=UPI00257A4944|nr:MULTISPECIES: efflux RND transporter periplasmic adaptor subunit [Brevundimonas]